MNESTRKRRDFIQNLIIALLSVSAVALFIQTQLSILNAGGRFLDFWDSSSLPASAQPSAQSGGSLSAPVRVAISGSYGRYGNVALSTSDKAFDRLRSLLEQGLDSARNHTPSSEQAFRKALSGTSVYYDFLVPLPLPVLGQLVGVPCDLPLSARRIAIAQQNGRVKLFLQDENGRYLQYDTSISSADLDTVIVLYELGNASFAFELPDANAQKIGKYSLFLAEEPEVPILSSRGSQSDSSHLLGALHFNPNTQLRYPAPDGSEVIVESRRTLRVRSDGTVIYQNDGDSPPAIRAEGEIPTLSEATFGVSGLLNSLLAFSPSDASLYLEQIQQTGDSTTLYFGYQVRGVPVHFSDGQSAAYVTLSGTTVTFMSLRLRHYQVEEIPSLLLPRRQALAIAAHQPGEELFIGYTDYGISTTRANWLAES